MKAVISKFPLVAAVLALGFMAVSCEKNTGTNPAGLSFDEPELVVNSLGGEFTVTYTSADFISYDLLDIQVDEGAGWMNGFDISVPGKITFNIDEYLVTEPRQAGITLVYDGKNTGETLVVRQEAFDFKVRHSEFDGKVLNCTYGYFDKDKTLFYEILDGDFYYDPQTGDPVKITAGEYAEDLVNAYNADHPDAPVTIEDALYYDFTQKSGGFNTYFEFDFKKDGYLVAWSGSSPDMGAGVAVNDIRGKYTFDEETGIVTVAEDVANTTFTREVQLKLSKTAEGVIQVQIVKTENPYSPFIKGDIFPFVLFNYDQTKRYQPAEYTLYDVRVQDYGRFEDFDYH